MVPAVPFTTLLDCCLVHLEAEGITDALDERIRVGAVISDLCELAEVRPPAALSVWQAELLWGRRAPSVTPSAADREAGMIPVSLNMVEFSAYAAWQGKAWQGEVLRRIGITSKESNMPRYRADRGGHAPGTSARGLSRLRRTG
jgi:hypothetical protein